MNTDLYYRKTSPEKKPTDIVTGYQLEINDHKKETVFLTLDRAECDIKALEVLAENNEVFISYKKFTTTRAVFMAILKENI